MFLSLRYLIIFQLLCFSLLFLFEMKVDVFCAVKHVTICIFSLCFIIDKTLWVTHELSTQTHSAAHTLMAGAGHWEQQVVSEV